MQKPAGRSQSHARGPGRRIARGAARTCRPTSPTHVAGCAASEFPLGCRRPVVIPAAGAIDVTSNTGKSNNERHENSLTACTGRGLRAVRNLARQCAGWRSPCLLRGGPTASACQQRQLAGHYTVKFTSKAIRYVYTLTVQGRVRDRGQKSTPTRGLKRSQQRQQSRVLACRTAMRA